ncbi:MAG: hypothetical protein M1833_007242 [Piccolia ochrophora]|nr:MAG: hypothetical protein M1833_007242 [Piccolia ochrophora]
MINSRGTRFLVDHSRQKAAKQTARRNSEVLNRTHLITALIHAFFLILRFVLLRRRRTSILLYLLFSAPALVIEFWLERIGRPSYVSGTTDLRKSGEDLEAKGLTEYLWDVLYWSWACIVVVAVFGNKGWWSWVAIPLYSAWLGYTTFGSMSSGLGGLAAGGKEGVQGGQSNRQKKMDKRGGQRVQYR